jgi:hypothetical protein
MFIRCTVPDLTSYQVAGIATEIAFFCPICVCTEFGVIPRAIGCHECGKPVRTPNTRWQFGMARGDYLYNPFESSVLVLYCAECASDRMSRKTG